MAATQIDRLTPVRTVSLANANRLISVDVLRGICVAGMILVNFPADWVVRYSQLSHADWDGATATDMIFPMFLFLTGFSMTFSFAARSLRGGNRAGLAWHVITRSTILAGLGLALNAFPDFDWRSLHIPGVLQRIALCYLVGGLFTLATARGNDGLQTDAPGRSGGGAGRTGFAVNCWAVTSLAIVVLAGVWVLVRFVPVPGYGSWRFDHEGNLGAVIDRAIFGNRHLSDWGGPARMWDADGLLSSVTSIPNLLVGVLAAEWIRRGRNKGRSLNKTWIAMAGTGLVMIVAALALNPYLVINRKIWTDSFVLLSGGVSLGVFALFYAWLDVRGVHHLGWGRRAFKPAFIYGSNAILGFAIFTILWDVQGLYRLPGAHGPANWIPGSVYQVLCRWIDPYNASVVYGMAFVVLVMLILWPLYERKIFLRL